MRVGQSTMQCSLIQIVKSKKGITRIGLCANFTLQIENRKKYPLKNDSILANVYFPVLRTSKDNNCIWSNVNDIRIV